MTNRKDKNLIKQRFTKSLKTYNDNACVQKHMAEKLVQLLPRRNFGTIFEIGAGTGLLTEQIKKNLVFDEYSCCDIVSESREYINKIIPENKFTAGDIEEIKLEAEYDLIISNAALQWCSNIEEIIEKLKRNLKENGILAVSIFGNDNFKELKDVLNLPDTMNTSLKGIEEIQTLYFNSPLDVLKHIKASGANALTRFTFTKSALKNFEENYKKHFSTGVEVRLTYNPLYILKQNYRCV